MGVKSEVTYDVVIIGAGISGLKAASELYKNGAKNCLVLETRDRIGGRLLTEKSKVFPERCYDLGASWHHDTLANPLFDEEMSLPKEQRAPYMFDNADWVVVDSEGNPLDHVMLSILESIHDELDRFVENTYFKSVEAKDVSYFEIVMQYLFNRRDSLTDEQILHLPQVARRLEFWHGIDWKRLGAKYSAVEANGRNAIVLNYNVIVNRIANSFPKEWIKLKTEVLGIERRKDRVYIKTNTGELYAADYCIVTVPQSILELSLQDKCLPGKIEFSPPFDSGLKEGFKHTHFASLGKIFLEFDKCTWNPDRSAVLIGGVLPQEFVRAVRDAKSANSLIDVSSKLESGQGYSGYPLYFFNLQRSMGSASVLILVQKPLTEYLESLSRDALLDFIKVPIQNALKAFESSEDVIFDLDDQILNPGDVPNPVLKNILRSNWSNDPYSLGSYGASYTGDDMLLPILAFINGQGPHLRFAGEHTTVEGAGCTYGAWASGKREARYVLQQMKSSCQRIGIRH